MPILKPISGHGSTGGIRRYLEKGGRALARDLFNLSYDERDAGALGNEDKEACAWDAEMDATRAAFGTDAPWRGKPARTFKHFVLSPDPGDDIDLAALRELACSWALKHFGDHEIAIVYHDDNARGIPHAHIVVNNANLRTGYRMQTQHPEDLNRDLQDMARERGLSGLSNDRAPESPSKARGRAGAGGPRSRRSGYLGRAEKEIMRSGGYSWVGDIRARVALAKTTARDEAEFLGVLDALGVHVADNSAKARRDDWVFSLAEEPSKKVSGERLGFVYGKELLRRRFARGGAYRPTDASAARIRAAGMPSAGASARQSSRTWCQFAVSQSPFSGSSRISSSNSVSMFAPENGEPSVNESVSNSVVLPPSYSILTIISGPFPCDAPAGPAGVRRRGCAVARPRGARRASFLRQHRARDRPRSGF